MFIYKITNLINGKIYIGKTTYSINKRFKDHCSASKSNKVKTSYLHKAIRKYGSDNFKIEEIDEPCLFYEELDQLEKYWIHVTNSYNPNVGYNLTLGGDGGIMTEEAMKKHKLNNPMNDPEIRKKHLEIMRSEKMRKIRVNGSTGRKWSEESKKKLSEHNPMKDEASKNKHREKVTSEEYRKKMSELVKNREVNMGYLGGYFKRIYNINKYLYKQNNLGEYDKKYFRDPR